MPSSFEDTYPHIAEWVRTHGWIEVGQDEYSDSLVRALDIGGLVWEGANSYDTLDAAFQALEAELAAWMTQAP